MYMKKKGRGAELGGGLIRYSKGEDKEPNIDSGAPGLAIAKRRGPQL